MYVPYKYIIFHYGNYNKKGVMFTHAILFCWGLKFSLIRDIFKEHFITKIK